MSDIVERIDEWLAADDSHWQEPLLRESKAEIERLRIELAQAETLILAAKVFVADYKIVRPETSASWLRDADKWLAAAAIRKGEP